MEGGKWEAEDCETSAGVEGVSFADGFDRTVAFALGAGGRNRDSHWLMGNEASGPWGWGRWGGLSFLPR